MMGPVQTGLDRLANGEGPLLRGAPISVLCHPASVDKRLRHVTEILAQHEARIVSLLGPEHGITAAAQDMESVAQPEQQAETPVYSLYGDDEASLWATPAMLHGAQWLVVDLQDVGARYYTYVWTAVMAAEVALAHGVKVLILDRPNPLGGTEAGVEGGLIADGHHSFVGFHSVSVRHGMTLGELATMTLEERGRVATDDLEVLECRGWTREMFFDQTDLPWVLPSPNMPTLDTATVYPGQCLIEGTNLSEARGTTRPFELCGAPWLDANALAAALREEDAPGLGFRAVAFKPGFQKHAGVTCQGVQIHVHDRRVVRSVALSWALLRCAWATGGGQSRWRTETYEFVDEPIAIDLLAGGPWLRQAVEAGTSTREMLASQQDERLAFLERRRPFLRYG